MSRPHIWYEIVHVTLKPQSEENAVGWFSIIKIAMGKMKEKVSFQITWSIGLIEGNAIKSLFSKLL